MADSKYEQTRIIEELIEGLKSAWNEDIRGSIHALASFGEPVIMPLMRALETGSSRMCCHAASILSEIPSEESVPALLWILKEKPLAPAFYKTVLDALIQSLQPSEDDRHLLDYLRSISRHEDPDVRKAVAKGFGRLQSPSALTTLHFLQEDSHPVVRHEAEKAFQALRHHAPATKNVCLSAQTIAAALRLHTREIPDAQLKATPPQGHTAWSPPSSWQGVVTELSPRLRSAGHQTLEELAPLLLSFPLPEASESLRSVVADDTASEERRLAALSSLHQLHPKEPSLLPLIRDLATQATSAKLRLAALQIALQIQPSPPEIPYLLFRLLRDPSFPVQEEAAKALPSYISRQKKEPALRFLLEALRIPLPPSLRLSLFQALDQLLDGAPEDSLLTQDLLDWLPSASDQEASTLLRILSRLRLHPSQRLSHSLLAFLQRPASPEDTSLAISLLRYVLSSSHTQIVSQLHTLADHLPPASSHADEIRQILTSLPAIPLDSGGFPTFSAPATPALSEDLTLGVLPPHPRKGLGTP